MAVAVSALHQSPALSAVVGAIGLAAKVGSQEVIQLKTFDLADLLENQEVDEEAAGSYVVGVAGQYDGSKYYREGNMCDAFS